MSNNFSQLEQYIWFFYIHYIVAIMFFGWDGWGTIPIAILAAAYCIYTLTRLCHHRIFYRSFIRNLIFFSLFASVSYLIIQLMWIPSEGNTVLSMAERLSWTLIEINFLTVIIFVNFFIMKQIKHDTTH